MAHGTPDYGVTAGAETTHQLTDLGELAVRLGSIDAFDRRGDVIWWDDFECGSAAWDLGGNGVGHAAAIDIAHPRNGAQALKLTAGSNLTHHARAYKTVPYPVLTRFGVEVSFGTTDLPESLDVSAVLYDGARGLVAEFNWDAVTGKLQYYDASATPVDVAAYTVYATTPFLYNTMKLVWDAKLGLYTRLLFNERAIDLSGIPLQSVVNATPPNLFVGITNTGRAGSNDAVYVDDVIVTQNEPA